MNNDNKYGDFLVSKELATKKDIDEGLNFQRQTISPMGKIAVKAGYLSRKENINLLIKQKETGGRYGDLALERSLLTKEQIEEVLNIKKGESISLGKTLVSLGVLTRKENAKALVEFHGF